MPVHNPGLHHFHRRKRIYLKHEPYPHPDKWKRLIDKLVYVVGIAGPVMTLPQVTKIWLNKNAAGISLPTWITYAAASLIWTVYGVIHKDKPITISSLMFVVVNLLVVVGALIYG